MLRQAKTTGLVLVVMLTNYLGLSQFHTAHTLSGAADLEGFLFCQRHSRVREGGGRKKKRAYCAN